MSATAGQAGQQAADSAGGATDAGAPRKPTAAEVAWIALVPCALVALLAMLLLAAAVGELLFAPNADGLWPRDWWAARGTPEPAKHGRYVLAVLAPALLAGAILVGVRRAPALRPRTIRALVWASQAALLAFVALALLGQHDVVLPDPATPRPEVFGVGRLLLAAALVAAGLLAMRAEGVARRVARAVRETPRRRLVLLALATLIAAAWMLRAIYTDAMSEDLGRMSWTLNDAFAVLDGRTPLVDFNPVYSKLLPYPSALALLVFGDDALTYTLSMTVLSVLALVGVFAIFRRVVRSSALGLALFVPFLALTSTGLPLSPLLLPAMWPMRYGGAFLIAWLTARQLDGCRPRGAWVVFLVGSLVAINTVEFGAAAILATIAALLAARPPRSPRALLPLAGHAAAGLLGGVVLVALFTLVRAGELPSRELFVEWPRIFTNMGWFALPVPRAGLHLAIYATFFAAAAVATVRVVRGAQDTLLTGMVAWSGVFGLVAAGYYVGRPDELKLVSMFGAWGFALALLAVVCVRSLAARAWRRPALADLLVLFGCALAVLSIGRFPQPWDELERLTRAWPAPQYRPAAEAFIRERTAPGEPVTILLPMGHRMAYDLGLRNVAAYGLTNAIVTREQLDRVIEEARREGVHEIFVPDSTGALAGEGQTAGAQLERLAAAGYVVRSADESGILQLSDR